MSRLPLVSPVDRILFLKAQSFLEGVPSDVLSVLASFSEEEFYPSDSRIREPGGSTRRILFLAEGLVEVDRGEGGAVPVEAPATIGLVDHFARCGDAPSVRAASDSLGLAVDALDLEVILEDHFALFHRFASRAGEEIVRVTRALGPDRPDEAGFEGAAIETPVVLDLVHRLACARRAPLLRRANLTMLGELIRFDDVSVLRAGEAVWRAGDAIDRMALVLDGSFRTDGEAGEARAPAGAVLGAWEVLSDGKRREGWLAESTSRVLWIRRDLFTDLLEDHFELALDYLQQQCRRILAAWALGGSVR